MWFPRPWSGYTTLGSFTCPHTHPPVPAFITHRSCWRSTRTSRSQQKYVWCVCVWLFLHLIISFELKEGKMPKGHLCCSLGGASVRVFVQSCAVVWGPFPGWCIVLFSHCCVTVIVSKHKLLSIIKHWFPTPSLSPSCSPPLSFTVMSTSLPLWLLLFPFFYPFF